MINNKVHWGAIFAGSFIGIASMVFFSLFALATGISSVSVIQPIGSTITLGGAFYEIVTSIISFALAGYCTVRMAGVREPGSACLHALTSFSLAGGMVPFLFTRTFFLGAGFAIAPPPGPFLSLGLSWTIFFSFGFAAVAACAGGVQASYRKTSVVIESEVYERAA